MYVECAPGAYLAFRDRILGKSIILCSFLRRTRIVSCNYLIGVVRFAASMIDQVLSERARGREREMSLSRLMILTYSVHGASHYDISLSGQIKKSPVSKSNCIAVKCSLFFIYFSSVQVECRSIFALQGGR